MKRNYKIVAAVAVILIVSMAVGTLVFTRDDTQQNISIEIDPDGLTYIVGYCGGYGPKMLQYREHKDMIDRVVEMVSGEYVYQETWSDESRSGGGPNLIEFYTEDGGKEYEIRYVDGMIAVATNDDNKYYLYGKADAIVSFDDFEEYLNLHGKA